MLAKMVSGEIWGSRRRD